MIDLGFRIKLLVYAILKKFLSGLKISINKLFKLMSDRINMQLNLVRIVEFFC